MVRDDLKFSPRTARRVMEIARHTVISDRTRGSDVPPSWRTLYELTKVESKLLEVAIKEGRVNPKMERNSVSDPRRVDRRG